MQVKAVLKRRNINGKYTFEKIKKWATVVSKKRIHVIICILSANYTD